MASEEVPRNQWDSFLSRFSRQHAGHRISLELRKPRVGTVVEVEDGKLENVLYDHANGEQRISIVVGDAPESEHFTHVVDEPNRMRLGESEELEIEAEEGTILLRFRPGKAA